MIPWVALKPNSENFTGPTARYVPAAPSGAPPCRAIRYAGTQGLNSVSDLYYLAVRNRSSRTCVLEGRPWIVVLPEGTGPVAIRANSHDAWVPPGFPTAGARFGLRPGQTASVTLSVERPCDHELGTETSQRLRALLPEGNGGSAYFTIASCKRQGVFVSVGVFAPPAPPDRKPLMWPLRASLELPGHVTSGQAFSYRVRVTNTSRRPFSFPYCPAYTARVNGTDRFGVLNCRRMATLRPGERTTFAMRRFVTEKLPPGRYELTWALWDETRKAGVTARGSLRVGH